MARKASSKPADSTATIGFATVANGDVRSARVNEADREMTDDEPRLLHFDLRNSAFELCLPPRSVW